MRIDEFLLARIAEDEAAARALSGEMVFDLGDGVQWAWSMDRLAAECEAKRRTIDDILRYESRMDYEWGCSHNPDQIRAGWCDDVQLDRVVGLRILAAVYASHPDFDPAWAVDSTPP